MSVEEKISKIKEEIANCYELDKGNYITLKKNYLLVPHINEIRNILFSSSELVERINRIEDKI